MIHDLTANGDFNENKDRWDIFNSIHRRIVRKGDLVEPDKEIILTGTATDRDLKRYLLDCENDRKSMCDCCGAQINIIPWNFQNYNTLCDSCMEMMDYMHGEKFMDDVNEIIGEDHNTHEFVLSRVKPWNFSEDRVLPTENVLLWD